MLNSGEFRRLLMETASQLIENGLSDEYCLEVFNAMTDELEPEAQRDLMKWSGRRLVYEQFKAHIISAFSEGRLESWLSSLQEFIGAGDEEMSAYFPDYY